MPSTLKQYVLDRQKSCQEGYEAFTKMGAWDGFYKTLSSLYPDNAHFVYELLQNAEDAKASKVKFELLDGSLIFKHNGSKDFSEKDIESITNVGSSSKMDDTNTIGKFGVGFKSVFAYTTAPKIYSKTIDFEIEHLFIPSLIEHITVEDGYTTKFIFPFDREDKSKVDAFIEVKALFDEISDNVLLFLTNIQTIKWQVANATTHQITKLESNELIEINNTQKGISHWLVFRDQIEFDNKSLMVSVAYSYNKEKNEIKPINGNVSIFFPAKKETSKLKFHIDAPFASTVARDSIKDSVDNDHLMINIMNLCRKSIHKIKEKDLLSMSYFEVLPNKDDELEKFYQPILDGFLEEFNLRENLLIPLDNGSFGGVNSSIYCSSIVRDTFNDQNDIYHLFNNENILGFGKYPLKNSRSHKFLAGLDEMDEYENSDVFNSLYDISKKISNSNLNDEKDYAKTYDDPDDLNFILNKRKWLESKNDEYLQGMYAFLNETIEQYSEVYVHSLDGKDKNYLDLNCIIKLSDETFNYGSLKSFFINENGKSKESYTFVSPKTYTSGKSKSQKLKSKKFLEKIGVESVDESTHIEYLFFNYEFISEKEHLKDINNLVRWFIKEQSHDLEISPDLFRIDLHKESYICAKNTLKMYQPNKIYIDDPFLATGLGYLDDLIENYALHSMYQKLENPKIFIEILINLGAITSLHISKAPITENQAWITMWRESRGQKETSTRIREDWNIDLIQPILKVTENKFKISQLIWNTLNSNLKINHLTASYRKSQTYEPVFSKSQLISNLMLYEWIPDRKGNFYKPQDIDEEMLAEGFNVQDATDWLNEVEFGKNILHEQSEYKEKQALFGEFNMTIEQAEQMREANISKADFDAFINQQKTKKLKVSLLDSSGSGRTIEVAPNKSPDSVISDSDALQKGISNENLNIFAANNQTFIPKQSRFQDPKELKKIQNFLYSEYQGHCQICGDTFMGNQDKNVFEKFSLNRGKKGDRLTSDVNRKGNTLCLCPKHHKIFFFFLMSLSFLEKFDLSELSLNTIKDSFEFYDGVGREDIFKPNDGFYNRPLSSDFEADVFMLPIKIFEKSYYLKFTQEHIQNFIEVLNNN